MKPGYQQTEVGVVPDDWDVRPLAEVAKVTSGKRLPLGYFVGEKVTPYPYIRVTDMRPGRVDTRDIKYVPEAAYPPISKYRIFKDDLFISVAGSLGIVGSVPDELDGANLTENADRISAITCDKDYLLHVMLSAVVQGVIESEQTVGAQPKLALMRIRNFSIPLPPTEAEQRAIAAALSDVDALLGGLDRLIAKKRDLKQAAMQQLLTGQSRLPGFSGAWEMKRLGDHVTFLRNGVNSRAELQAEGRVKYLHYGDIHASANSLLSPQTLPSLPDAKAARLDRLHDGDVIFADASEDIAGVCKSVELRGARDIEVVSGLHTIAARFAKTVLADGFKGFLQYCPSFATHLRRLAAGTKVYATNRAHIASVEMRLPSVAEQTAIAAVLSDIDAELAALEARRDKTRDLKQAMMQELLTGRTRLV